MKVFRGIINFVLIVIIISGIGFLAWNIMYNSGNMQGMNMGDTQNNTGNIANTQDNTAHNAMPDMQNKTSLNVMDIKNKDSLNQVLTIINDAVNQITIDPYSKITVPRASVEQNDPRQQGNTTVNIYPNTNNTVNVPPQGTTPPTTGTNVPNASVVYNQGKLEQLHSGIFKLSQGLMLLNELNDDLILQVTNQQPENYESYIMRYNTLYQNKVKLSKSLNLINEGSMLVNVNPYASGVSYEYDASQMDQLNKGIYKLAQGMYLGVKLGEDFTKQMVQVNSLVNNTSMSSMNMTPSYSIGNIDVKLILYILVIVFVLTFIIALFGAVRATFRSVK